MYELCFWMFSLGVGEGLRRNVALDPFFVDALDTIVEKLARKSIGTRVSAFDSPMGNSRQMEIGVKIEVFSARFDEDQITVTGFAKNDGHRNASFLVVRFDCYDIDGVKIASAIDSTSGPLPGDTWKFNAIGIDPQEKAVHCSEAEVVAN